MATMTVFDEQIEVECGSDVSEHGVPYTTRLLTLRHEFADYEVSVHIYPKTTIITITKSPDVPSSGNAARDFYEYGWLYRTPTATYKANARNEIEQAIAAENLR